MLDLSKQYKSITGAVRTPLYLSDCSKFVFTNCKYKNGIELNKWFWVNHRLFISTKNE